ncbi:MAG: HAD family hydrolase [Planctomycetes bacterium]|nr:HAD family hydrolase [Planctomycetota bacterium]
MAIQAVLFDLGNTLIDFESEPAATLHRRAEDAVQRRLVQLRDATVPGGDTFRAHFARAWAVVEERHRADLGQPALAEAIGEVLAALGIPASPEEVAALEAAHYEVIRAQIRPYPEAGRVLECVRRRGLGMALVSNTIWPAAFHRADLAALGWDRTFEPAIFSRDFGRRKPHPSIFRAALERLAVAPGEAVVVGDRAEADIEGARNVGCRAVLKLHPFTRPADPAGVAADAVIERLDELLDWLDRN